MESRPTFRERLVALLRLAAANRLITAGLVAVATGLGFSLDPETASAIASILPLVAGLF